MTTWEFSERLMRCKYFIGDISNFGARAHVHVRVRVPDPYWTHAAALRTTRTIYVHAYHPPGTLAHEAVPAMGHLRTLRRLYLPRHRQNLAHETAMNVADSGVLAREAAVVALVRGRRRRASPAKKVVVELRPCWSPSTG